MPSRLRWCAVLGIWLAGSASAGAQTPADADASAPGIFDILDEERNLTQQVTSVTKSSQSQAETPAIVTVITRAEIVERGFRTIGEALQWVPGLYIIDDFVTSNIGVRGVSAGADSWSRVIKVLIDGSPVTFYANGGALLGPEFLAIEHVEAIEIIRGPASALYGGNAFLGVVNVRTRGAAHQAEGQAAGEGGFIRNNPSGGASIFGAFKLADEQHPSSLTMSATGSSLDRSGLGVPAASPAAGSYAGAKSVGDISKPVGTYAKAVWDAGKFGSVELRALYQRVNARSNFSDLSVLSRTNRIAISNLRLQVGYKLALLEDKLRVEAFAAYTEGKTLPEQILDVGERNYTVVRDRKNQAAETGLEVSYRLSRHFFLVGADLLSDLHVGDGIYHVGAAGTAQEGNLLLSQRAATLRYTNIGAYAQALFYPHERFGVTLGMRYDVNSQWGKALSARAALVYHPLERLHLKLMYGSSFVPPSPVAVSGFPLRTGGLAGNPNLANQLAHTVELAADWAAFDWLSARLNGYWTFIDKRIENIEELGAFGIIATNLTTSNTFGLEMAAEARWKMLFAKVDFSLQQTLVAEPTRKPSYWDILYSSNGPVGALPPGYPPWHSHVAVGVTPPGWHVQAVASALIVGPRKSSLANLRANRAPYALASYATFDLNLRTADVKLVGERLTAVSLHVNNILNTAYAEAGSLGVDIPAVGRMIFLKVTQEF